ncbi:MAG: hypothetical protein COZ12_05380 [Deltaproteobacteria bacterium CG_4_10_14_3_um_filter_60_8]|nr:MAG: hypothetical protein AUK28_10150 [Desulfobacterales bacterium CG2_30_60_27]PIP44066.1 MAG: hypothetical protein COX17_03505 [Deltaproteobacteria bacterium CG23_combo_of_CG06-09_8_20_14_all_60_8]PIY21316.1 MAG: hypothetical protein COZ12_05380 [Deltaproteobacteria bacterium CG_4_10_14_3_um_filter_60_8]
MSKKAIVSALALTFLLGAATVGFAAKIECTVDAVDAGKVTMTCKDAGDLKAGDAVEVKAAKAAAKKKMEGC